MDTPAAPIDIKSGQLPPIGEITPQTEGAAVESIYSRRLGIINSLAQPIRLARMCRKVATWGENLSDESTPDEVTVIVHKIRQAIETQAGNHLNEPAKVTIEPVETGEYAKWYWCGPEEAAQELTVAAPIPDPTGQPAMDQMGQPLAQQMPLIDPMYLGAVGPDGTVYPPLPLPLALVKTLKQMAMADPDLIDPGYICKLDDEFTAKTLQKQFDADWRTAQGEKWLRHTVYGNIIEGWKLPLYEFDPNDPRKHLLRRNSIEQTYIAQDCEDVDDAAEAGIDLYIDLDEALAKAKDDQHRTAMLTDVVYQLTSPQAQGHVPVAYRGLFYRPMVRKIVWWLRNQPINVPMGEQEAVDGGHVQDGSMGTGNAGFPIEGDFAGVSQSVGAGVPPDSTQEPQDGVPPLSGAGAVGGMGVPESDPGLSQPPAGLPDQNVQGGVPLGASYVLPISGQPVDPTHPAWPTKPQTALRRVTIIAGRVVEDIVEPLPDIPIIHFRNTIVIGRPWGVGEPFYAKRLQDVYSKITNDAADHVDYAAHPAREMHQGLKDFLEKQVEGAHINPNTVYGVPADYWNPAQPFIRLVEAPPFPDSSIKIREMVGNDFNDLFRQDVLAGKPPTPNASGKMVDSLSANAVGPLNFKAGDIAYALEKTAKLMLFSILNLTDPQEISDTTSVPMPLLSLVLQRAKKRAPNVKVTISTGAGQVIQRKRQETLAYNQTIDPATKMPLVSGRTARGVLGVDNGIEDRNNEDAIRHAATAMAPLMQQANPEEQGGEQEQQGQPAGNGEDGGGQASSNGNGRFH